MNFVTGEERRKRATRLKKRKFGGYASGEEENESSDEDDEKSSSPTTKTSIREDSVVGPVEFVDRDQTPPNPSVAALLASIRKHAPERSPSPPQKRLRRSESTPRDVTTAVTPENTINSLKSPPPPPLSPSHELHEPDDDRVFETCLGDDKAIAFLFAPCTISLQHFFHRFCEVWKMDAGKTNFDDVRVKVCIVGAGEYHLSFGPDREKSWHHIMRMAQGESEFHILVTVGN